MSAWSVPHTALAARTCIRIGPDDPSPWRVLRTQPYVMGQRKYSPATIATAPARFSKLTRSNRSRSGSLSLLRCGGMNPAQSTIIAWRLAEPAPKGVIERADFGIAERKGDFRQRQRLVFQEVQSQRLAHIFLDIRVVQASLFQAPLQRPHRHAHGLGEVLDAALALHQHAADLATQLP